MGMVKMVSKMPLSLVETLTVSHAAKRPSRKMMIIATPVVRSETQSGLQSSSCKKRATHAKPVGAPTTDISEAGRIKPDSAYKPPALQSSESPCVMVA